MSLESLPAELQIEVFSYLDNSDLKAARASSRRLRDNASPALFRSIVACARYDALGAFQNIALHPVLQTYVKEITFDGSLYNLDPACNERVYQRQAERFEETQSSDFWTNRTRWKRYKELYTEQEDLKVSGVLLQTMARALEWTTNVSSIVFSPHAHLIPIEVKVVRGLLPRDVMRDRLGHQARPLLPRPGRQEHPFRYLIGALYMTQYTGVRTLRIEAFRQDEPGTPLTFGFFELPDATDLQAAQHLFRNLERCELNVKVRSVRHDSTLWSSEGDEKKLANLRNMLAVSNNLRNLSFHITGWKSSTDPKPLIHPQPNERMFTRLGLKKTWPELQSLSLEGIYADEEDIINMIKRHSSTLRSIIFRKCCLFSGAWANVVDEIVYNTRIFPFVLDSCNETHYVTAQGTTQGLEDMEMWMYEGHVDVLQNGDRTFVDVAPTKMSVYHLRNM